MQKSVTYSDREKAAIVSLLIEMVNIDDHVVIEELAEINNINAELNVNQENFEMGKALKLSYAIDVVRQMSQNKKIVVGKFLTRIIDADGMVKSVELKLLNDICHRTGLDIIMNKLK